MCLRPKTEKDLLDNRRFFFLIPEQYL